MVGSSVKEPYRGWTDTLSALGGIMFFGGVGVYNYALGDGSKKVDLVPVDLCCNHIILATYHCGITQSKEEVQVYNHSSS